MDDTDRKQKKRDYSSGEDFWKALQNFFDLHYRRPPVDESVVSELVSRYKRKHPEEFSLKPRRKSFPHPDKNASA